MALAFIDGALEDLKLMKRELFHPRVMCDLRIALEALRTFLLCAGKWHNNVCLKSDENTSSSSGSPMGSLLSRLEDSLIQNGKDFRNLCLRANNATSSDVNISRRDMVLKSLDFGRFIYSFRQEISESYITLADYYSLQSEDRSTEFIDSLQRNMADLGGRQVTKDPFIFETLEEKLIFFKNFLRFAELQDLESWQFQVLFTNFQVVAVNAARVYNEWVLVPYEDRIRLRLSYVEFLFKLSEVLLKIKPADPRVREIYVHVLTASNVPGSSHALSLERGKHLLGDFVDSLLHKILEALTYCDSYMISVKDQVPMFYEGLRFLRTILTEHLKKMEELHEKVKDLIGAAVNEAAIVICSHEFELDLPKETHFALFNFLEKIKLIKVITSEYIFPTTNKHGYVDFLLENLKDLPSCKVDSIVFAKDQIQIVQEDLASLVSFLEILDRQNRDGKLHQSLWSRVADVACKTRLVIESLVAGDIPDCSPLAFEPITEEINLIKMEAFKIGDIHCSSKAQKADKTSIPSKSQDSTPPISKIEGSLDDEANKIIGLLIRGSKLLDIISIVGMPGLGKTTLARRVFDDPSVKNHFCAARAWCVVSQVYKKKNLLLQILGSIDPEFSDANYSTKDEGDLEEKLRKCLLKKRYLIILDDVWDSKAWSGFENSFPNDRNSSRILVTSRHAEVAREINPNTEPHFLRLLTVDESWDLLQKMLACKESYPLDLGKRIAKNCKGLPLTIVIVAGILSNLEQDSWAEIARRLSLSDFPILDQCMDMLEVSYKNLPENLKSCLLYFGAFGEDQEVSCRTLIWLWIAEGFVQKSEAKSLEDVAKDYMNGLISRSLVMVSEKGSLGGVKTCRVHDMLHEFCVVKAKKEKFMSILSEHDEVFTFQVQRLCVHSTVKHFVKSRPFSFGVRSLLFLADEDYLLEYKGIPHLFHFFKLKVLDLMQVFMGHIFPREILLFVELRYLAVKGTFGCIPSSIAKLSNLETLVLLHQLGGSFLLPVTIWNMSKLRVLWSNGKLCLTSEKDSLERSSNGNLCLTSEKDNLERSSNLHNLDNFSVLRLLDGQNMEKIMRKLPNIRRLRCYLFGSGESNVNSNRIVVMNFLSQLESLHLELPRMGEYHLWFRFPPNLKKLTLVGFHSSIIPKGGELPNLEVLKLNGIHFGGTSWDMNEEWEFSNLKFLRLDNLIIDRWTGTDGVDHFPSLEKLVLRSCFELKAVPSCLGDITTLQRIEVSGCRQSVVSSILQIKKYQKDYLGNEDLQVQLTYIRDDPSENEVEVESSEDEMDDDTK